MQVQLEISDFGFEMQDSSNFKILSGSVPQPEHPLLCSIHRALCEPFERCTEQYQMVLFPHCVVGRASEIDEYLLARAKIGEQISYTLGRDLFIVNARNHQYWDLRFPHHRCGPAPVRHLGRASYAAAPRGASYCAGQPTCRSQFAMNSSRDCVFMVAPSAGSVAGGVAAVIRLYAGASSTSF